MLCYALCKYRRDHMLQVSLSELYSMTNNQLSLYRWVRHAHFRGVTTSTHSF